MIAVLFEVWPEQDRREDYLELATVLREELEQVDGFVSVERFESLGEPGKLLSLSLFRDEAAVVAWRNLPSHRRAQALGRSGMFADYRLRIAQVFRQYGLNDRHEAPEDSRRAHN